MDTQTLIILSVLAVVLVLATIAATRYASRQPVSAVERSVEQDLFKVATGALTKLADTSGEDKEIAAAQQRKALKAQLLDQARQSLAQPVAPTQPVQ